MEETTYCWIIANKKSLETDKPLFAMSANILNKGKYTTKLSKATWYQSKKQAKSELKSDEVIRRVIITLEL